MSDIEKTFKELKSAKLVTEVYDAVTKKNSFMLTPKGAEWYSTLSQMFGTSPKKSGAKINLRMPKKETVNKVMNKTIDVMEGIAKFGQQIDKMTGGKPKISQFQQGNITGSPSQVKKRRYVKRKKNKRVKRKKRRIKNEKTKNEWGGMEGYRI